MKKTLIVLLAFTFVGCNMTTVRTKRYINYHNKGKANNPIVSYKVQEILTIRRTPAGKEYVFPILAGILEEGRKEGVDGGGVGYLAMSLLTFGIPLALDLASTILIAPFVYATEKSGSGHTELILQGKLVDVNNQPLRNYAFSVSAAHGKPPLSTDADGIFTANIVAQWANLHDIPVVFSFPDNKVSSITYQAPFKSGERSITSPAGNYTSSIPSEGKVLVLEPVEKPQVKQQKKIKKQRSQIAKENKKQQKISFPHFLTSWPSY